jgi:O-antigen ligase
VFGARSPGRAWVRVGFGLGVLVLLGGIFSTFSRSVVFPIGVILLATLIREMHSRRAYLIVLLIAVAGALITPRYYWERVLALREALSSTGAPRDWSVYTRWLAMTTAWELFLRHPFTGVGLGNFIVAGAYRLFVRIVVHNTYLEILVGTGIFGLVAFLGILTAGIRGAAAGARRRWVAQPEWVRSLSFYTALSGVSICLSAFFGTMPFRYPLWIPVAAGLVVGNLLRADVREPA